MLSPPQTLIHPGNPPDFRHIRTWIFDLDNTLYRAETALFAQIDHRMTQFVALLLGVSPDEARLIQKTYYRDHGTTLSGLVKLHLTDPEEFLAYVHDIDLTDLKPDHALNAAIDTLPGQRFVFTNGCRHHAQRVLRKTGLTGLFTDIWDIRTMGYVPKPQNGAYDHILTHPDIVPRQAAMFDDIARNLVPAQQRGLTTVWVATESDWSRQGPEFPVVLPENIHYETSDLAAFLHTIRT